MSPIRPQHGWWLAALLIGVHLAGQSLSGQTPGADKEQYGTDRILQGIYSESQAERGGAIYQGQCLRCHAPGEFAGAGFELTWTGEPLFELYRLIAGRMPLDSPGSLSLQQVSALVAYILSLNGYPTGDEPLGTDREILTDILIVPSGQESR